MKPVRINKTNRVDISKPESITAMKVLIDTLNHQKAVREVFEALVNMGLYQVDFHDRTKLVHLAHFTRYLISGLSDEVDPITGTNWFKDIHIEQERHHLNDRCPQNVTLIDIMEMVVDCVVAGLARDGDVRPITISNDILQAAVLNTVDLIKSRVYFEDTPESHDVRER